MPFILRDKEVQGVTCHHCTFVLRYKVMGGQLFTDSTRRYVCVRVGGLSNTPDVTYSLQVL